MLHSSSLQGGDMLNVGLRLQKKTAVWTKLNSSMQGIGAVSIYGRFADEATREPFDRPCLLATVKFEPRLQPPSWHSACSVKRAPGSMMLQACKAGGESTSRYLSRLPILSCTSCAANLFISPNTLNVPSNQGATAVVIMIWLKLGS